MKRRWIAGMMSAMLLVGMALPVSAADTKEMTVTYTEGEAYMLTIPADSKTLNLSTSDHVTGTVGVTNVNLAPGNKIQLSVTGGVDSSGVVALTRSGGSETLQSKLTLNDAGGAAVTLNAVFAEFTQDGNAKLNFSPLTTASGGTDIKAGEYSGTLTFSASIASATP